MRSRSKTRCPLQNLHSSVLIADQSCIAIRTFASFGNDFSF